MYGAKSLAVRDGRVVMYGQPKLPLYTKLNATAGPNANSITVNGLTNWKVGDTIVIASSSFYAWEVDEVTITTITPTADGNTVFGVSPALQYTHLGVIHSQAGVAAPLDMRAEVAVLNRNIR